MVTVTGTTVADSNHVRTDVQLAVFEQEHRIAIIAADVESISAAVRAHIDRAARHPNGVRVARARDHIVVLHALDNHVLRGDRTSRNRVGGRRAAAENDQIGLAAGITFKRAARHGEVDLSARVVAEVDVAVVVADLENGVVIEVECEFRRRVVRHVSALDLGRGRILDRHVQLAACALHDAGVRGEEPSAILDCNRKRAVVRLADREPVGTLERAVLFDEDLARTAVVPEHDALPGEELPVSADGEES